MPLTISIESQPDFKAADHTILVVDDSEDTRYLAKRILEHEGFKVLISGTGTDAIQIVRDKNIDLVLLDVRLPDISGFDVCPKLKEINDSILVIFFTVLSLNVDIERGHEAGGDGFLTKPFAVDDLLLYIKKLLASPRLQVVEFARKTTAGKEGI